MLPIVARSLVVLLAGLMAWLFAAQASAPQLAHAQAAREEAAPANAALGNAAPIEAGLAEAAPANALPDDVPAAASPQFEALLAAAKAEGQVRVIVGLQLPGGFDAQGMASSPAASAAQEAEIASAGAALLSRLGGHALGTVRTYDYIPYLAMTVDAAGLAALAADPQVSVIEEDLVVTPDVAGSVPHIRAQFAHLISYLGQGYAVAVLDTGIDKFHPALAGKVVSEACYSTNDGALSFTNLCPGGVNSIASGSGVNCAVTISGCHHGTHVGAIAAAVAPGANLISIQVFSRAGSGCAGTSPCTLSTVADILSGLNRVYALRNTYNIAAVNLSLGSGSYASACNTASTAVFNSAELLRAAGIVVVVSAGNNSYRSSMGWPACMSNVVSVGSITLGNQVSDFSNISSMTTLLAPGSEIYAAIPTAYGVSYDTRSGTSMAAPHVAGAVALLKSARPAATMTQLLSALSSTGPLIADHRAGGFISKRGLDAWAAVCALITCDVDDFRTLAANATLSGSISPSTDVDHYYYSGQAGQRLTLAMNRTSGSHDPYLELYNPQGFRVAFNNNGGGGVNALINGYLLPQTGVYRIRASNAGSGTGGYSLSASHQVVAQNPAPSITRLSPTSATGTPFGSDFWVAIYGSNFMPESQVRWNGQLRSKFYSSSSLIYIRVLGGDLAYPWPRLAFVSVSNPTPGGGTSNSYPFNVTAPFLGETELLAPESGSRVATGVETTLVISWTHPTESWRNMQNLDVRLRNSEGETAMWLRVSEETTLTTSLLNGAGTPVISTTMLSGQPGAGPDLVISDTVTLHTDESIFFGSGMTLIISPTLSFGPNAVGTWNIEFTVDNADGEIQDDDVLGTLIIHPPGCPVSLADVAISGPSTGFTGASYEYTASIDPADASAPVSYAWAPEPDSGQGTPNASYSWAAAGQHVVSVNVKNCGSFAAAAQEVQIATRAGADLAIRKSGPPVAVAGEVITYTLAIANNGAATASSIVVTDVLPAGAHYVSGGSLAGGAVTWNIAELAGYGTLTYTTLVVTANNSLTNTDYSASAAGVAPVAGSPAVVTRLVDDLTWLTPLDGGSLAYQSGQAGSELHIPEGSVFQDLAAAYRELAVPPALPPEGSQYAGRAFSLEVYADDGPGSGSAQTAAIAPAAALSTGGAITDFVFGEVLTASLTYRDEDVAGLNQSMLRLHYWDGSAWTRSGITCQATPSANRVDCSLANARAGVYALMETVEYEVYLPVVIR